VDIESVAMSLDRMPDLGRNPVTLTVKLPALKVQCADRMADGLRELFKRGEFTDVSLKCADQTFRAHRCVLATQSEVLRQGLAIPAGSPPSGGAAPQEVRLADIENPEAVKYMLDYMYGIDESRWQDYNPRTQEINKDVLRLSQNFELPGLTDRAVHWLAKDLSTANVVERLTICDDFGLLSLRELVLEQLTYNKRAFAEVVNSPQIISHPKLMQSMLQLAASVPAEFEAPPGKKLKKFGC